MNPNELPQEIQMEHSHQYHHQQPDAAGLTGD